MNFDACAFGERLKEERKRLGLSQASAADLCGIRREMWGKYERGQAEPGFFVIARLIQAGARSTFLLEQPN